jgi:hypothetical protein
MLERLPIRVIEIEAHPECVRRVLFTQHGPDPIDLKPARPLLALAQIEVVEEVPLGKNKRVAFFTGSGAAIATD